MFQFSAYPQVASLQAAEVLVDSVSSAARGASGTVECWDWALIQSKSLKYQGSTTRGIVLCTYVTDWRFALNDEVMFLLSSLAHTRAHCFESIFHLSHSDQSTVSVSRWFPIPDVSFANVDPTVFRGHRVMNIDPTRWRKVRSCPLTVAPAWTSGERDERKG